MELYSILHGHHKQTKSAQCHGKGSVVIAADNRQLFTCLLLNTSVYQLHLRTTSFMTLTTYRTLSTHCFKLVCLIFVVFCAAFFKQSIWLQVKWESSQVHLVKSVLCCSLFSRRMPQVLHIKKTTSIYLLVLINCLISILIGQWLSCLPH